MAEPAAAVPERIHNHPLIDEMQDSYLTYSMSVIMSRALPDGRDGLKPSQRRILVAMNDLNLGPRAQTKKCSKISGDTSGNYHPHGDAVIYPTLVRLAQPWNMRETLIEGQGNFGSIDGDPPAAMRYTEARMTHAAVAMLEDLEYETVDFVPNYDNSREEPTVLPGKFPNLLVNGATGIAVGMATALPPHNTAEVCDALLDCLANPHITLDELMRIVPAPDFPTGGQICGLGGVREAYATGRGSVVMRGRVRVEESKSGKRTIVIYEIPFGVLRSTITERIAAAVKSGQIKDVAAVNDASDRKSPVRIEIDLKREANEDVIINQLFQYTPLQSHFHIMNIALVDRQPRTLSLKQLLELYLDYRREVIRRRTAFLLRRAKQRAHILEGIILAVGDIDAIIELIKKSPDVPSARAGLMARALRLKEEIALRKLLPEVFVRRCTGADYHLTHVQADAILGMQLQRLTGLEVEKLAAEYRKLVEEIDRYEAILRDERLVHQLIEADLMELRRKFPDPRRTEIVGAVEDFRMEELIPDEQVVVTISHEGYIKRTDVDTYRKQGRGGRGVRGGAAKEGDFLEHLFVVSTHDTLLFFTSRGRLYWLRVYEVPVMSRTSRGRSIANLLRMREGETHRAVLPVREFEEAYVFFATAKGTVKKTPIQAFSRPRADGIIAINLDPDDTLMNAERTAGTNEIVLGTRRGMAIRFEESDVRAMGRAARGVRGMTLAADDAVVSMVAIEPGASVLTICENGYGKRTAIEEYRKTRRGGKGVINIRATERNGDVVAIRAVQDEDELMFITANGFMLRTDLSAVREIGRATQGVRLIRLEEDDKVVAVARIVKEEDEEEDAGSPESAETAADRGGETAEGSVPDAGAADVPPATDPTASADAPGEAGPV
ncbi:MAG TPA: DNA gyrase subunit A [Phycisphaerae bacterium]|nr:DNA gyrase subunit A [Phycisphaerae bacterium]HNU45882.1 DNA gyrase subunit A [Phycisphaerae bacterium]